MLLVPQTKVGWYLKAVAQRLDTVIGTIAIWGAGAGVHPVSLGLELELSRTIPYMLTFDIHHQLFPSSSVSTVCSHQQVLQFPIQAPYWPKKILSERVQNCSIDST